MSFTEHYAFRSKLVDQVERDLIGPTQPDDNEVITDRPITKYAAGILFPQTMDLVDEETLLGAEIEGKGIDVDSAPDPAVAMANVRYPSSMGLTFAVNSTITESVVVEVDVAQYVSEAPAERSRLRSTDHVEELWHRRSIPVEPLAISVGEAGQIRQPVSDNLELFVRIREKDARGAVAVTVALINKHRVPPGADRDPYAFFQPCITVRGSTETPVFVERAAPGTPDGDDELNSYRLLYRHAPTYATGHGCAVDWERSLVAVNDVATARSVRWISTTFVPRYDLWLADSNPDIDTRFLGMMRLAQAPDTEILSSLRSLTAGYQRWIEDRTIDAAQIPEEDLKRIAHDHLDVCAAACRRMEAGIDLLDGPVLEAFRLANEAMAMQRARTEWLRNGRPAESPDTSAGIWRPFQIAFILLSLAGIVDKESDDRAIADVLWFPTGGGKTEAYLGLIAFTTFLRRLRDPLRCGGVTVLMRYTLRLLTVQQFERAALLICCMENLRLRDPQRLGEPVISLGMWVGKAATPNDLDQAKTSLLKLKRGDVVQGENPVQLRTCPWCGRAIDHNNYKVLGAELTIACRSAGCEFAEGLPVHLVDETIYAARPTLIIATADKFASIPWRHEVASLFNLTSEDPPPELVIQDELHLISGPLGTLTGLYEAAVDLAAERPKVVASTATIRRADRQGKALFHRTVRQFPPPGLDSRDSYFSVETPPDDKATRLYAGLMTPSTSQTTLLVRSYASLLHHAAALEGSDGIRDPYWTLLGYFNSLRLLAGARLQVQDDVTDRLALLAKQFDQDKREIVHDVELTSREPSSEIPRHLQDMARSLPDEPIDVILATNMISVGVDVDRLGLMVVMGQPQSTSEYIQATSRVGRRWPGLVVTLFNSMRSRDRSHYENFAAYHSALYRQVEATSVTPFSARARDRGLHAVVVGIARLLITKARPNDAASSIEDFENELRAICDKVLDRVRFVAGQAECDATAHQIDEIIQHWIDRADLEVDLVYSNYRNPKKSLLLDAGHYDESNDQISETLPTLWSLRDVDVESKLYVARGQ